MQFNNQKRFEGSEKHLRLLAVMKEFGIIQGGYVPYEEAVEIYYKWLNKGVKPFVYKLFGEYSLKVKNYEMLTHRELETICDIFRSYKPKKLFSGVKMYRRAFAISELYKKERVGFFKPGDILWETTGLDVNTVKQMAVQATQAVGAEIEVYDICGMPVSRQ